MSKLQQVALMCSRREKISWNRKQNNLEELIKKLEPVETKILSLMAQKQEIIDELIQLRKIMVAECVHPVEHLVDHIKHVECKFCGRNVNPIKSGLIEEAI